MSHALDQARRNDSAIFGFEDMNWDPKTKRLLSVSLCTFQNSTHTQFVRCLIALDPLSHNLTRVSPHYWDLKHNDRIGVNSVLDSTARVVYEFMSTDTIELVGWSADTGKVATDISMPSAALPLLPTGIELGPSAPSALEHNS